MTSFTCPRGHQWEDPFLEEAEHSDQTVACPVCGEVAQPSRALPKTDVVAASPDTAATLPPGPSIITDPHVPAKTLTISRLKGATVVPPVDVPGYEILGELGRGGMGVVYKATQIKLNRTVALKMVLAGGHAGPQGLERFRIEAEAVARMQHPNIVQIYEIGEHNGLPFFSMEFVDGGSLSHQMDGRPLPPRAAAELVEKLARAIHAAHGRGIVHRDLKPANILLQKSETRNQNLETEVSDNTGSGFQFLASSFIPKITDFGLAKRLDAPKGYTSTGEIMGTPSYMSPEQAQGRLQDIGPATDVYALGAILYELLTGRPPFESDQAVDTLLQVVLEEPIPPARLQMKVPNDIDTICLKCLQKEPNRRYPSAEALADDLRRFLNSEPIQARPVGDWERALKWAKRRPAVALLLGVSAFAVVAVAVVSLVFALVVQGKNTELAASEERERGQANEARVQRDLADKHAAEVDRQRQITEKLLTKALDAERAVRDSLVEVEKQRKSAEASERKAKSAVDRMLMVVGRDLLEDVPGLDERKRRQLLESALEFYQGFLREKQTDPEMRQETGLAHFGLGRVHEGLGRLPQAETAYRQAAVLQDELRQEFPKNPRYRQDLAGSFNYLGEVLRKAGRPEEAEKAYTRARDLQQELNRELPKNSAYQQELARSLYNLGILERETGRKEAEDRFQQAIALLQPLTQLFPAEPEYRRELARCYLNFGNVSKDLQKIVVAKDSYGKAIKLYAELRQQHPSRAGYRQELADAFKDRAILLSLATADWGDARKDYLEAIALLRRLADDFPARPKYSHELAVCHGGLGGLSFFEKKLPDAELHYQQALAVQEKLAAEFGAVPEYQSGLGATLDNYAILLRELKRLPEARQRLDQGLKSHQAAFKALPRHPLYRKFLLNHYVVWANTVLRQGDHAELARRAAQLPQVQPDDWLECFAAADLLARALAAVKKDPKLADPDRQKLMETYTSQAIRMLEQAVQKGYTDAAALKASPAFEPLRSSKEFAKLLGALEKPAKP